MRDIAHLALWIPIPTGGTDMQRQLCALFLTFQQVTNPHVCFWKPFPSYVTRNLQSAFMEMKRHFGRHQASSKQFGIFPKTKANVAWQKNKPQITDTNPWVFSGRAVRAECFRVVVFVVVADPSPLPSCQDTKLQARHLFLWCVVWCMVLVWQKNEQPPPTPKRSFHVSLLRITPRFHRSGFVLYCSCKKKLECLEALCRALLHPQQQVHLHLLQS